MKHTYQFRNTDPDISQHRLERLVRVLQGTNSISWKYEGNSDEIRFVQMYTDETTVYHICNRALFPGVSGGLVEMVKLARKNGEPEVLVAGPSRFPPLPKPPHVDAKMQAKIDTLREAGCDIKVTANEDGFHTTIFGEPINICIRDNYNVVMAILHGIAIGFSSAPKWTGVDEHIVPRSQFDSVLELVNDHLSTKAAKRNPKMLAIAVSRAKEIIRQSLKAPSAAGSPQMGSTPATRRSKRSA